MPRPITLAAAQMGPVSRQESRTAVVRRMIELMRQAAAMGAQVVAYPEACLTAFFPHWWIED
ncbi:MAG: N-carbamoyl-D-amino-acid hydrolase, partial [Rhodoferax sp.]|nr:N-carbamoyl-D-amino-acid hydrolase [Rhodoferax sp.]MCB2028630.1 N-carbamoyl-D-amino-acid hydrolase [Rhodoferax sp.]